MSVRHALIFSDLHLGWVLCHRHHERLLAQLPELAADAELIVMNGDILDLHRPPLRSAERELWRWFTELVEGWRSEGREVVYVEGNHDLMRDELVRDGTAPLSADRWMHIFEGRYGERVMLLHGHRFAEPKPQAPGEGEAFKHAVAVAAQVTRLEAQAYARLGLLRGAYPLGPRFWVGATCVTEDRIYRTVFRRAVRRVLDENHADVFVHGHFHYGAGRYQLHGRPAYRSGAWVSPAHLRSPDRMLVYRDGRFERVGLVRGRWRAMDDGR